MIGIFKGMMLTLRHWTVEKPVTVQYPFEKCVLADRFRGKLALVKDPETGKLKCTACGICEKNCPDELIKVTPEGKGKERFPKDYEVNIENCMFCGICVESCPFDALTMTGEYELAVYDRKDLALGIEDLMEPEERKRPEATVTGSESFAGQSEESGEKPSDATD